MAALRTDTIGARVRMLVGLLTGDTMGMLGRRGPGSIAARVSGRRRAATERPGVVDSMVRSVFAVFPDGEGTAGRYPVDTA